MRERGHVTLSDVARACHLSVSTVSIVLSEAPLSSHVAETTRERIRVMAASLGYHPDVHARSLRRRRTQTVGVLAYDMSDPFCIPVVRGIEETLQAAQYFSLQVNAQTQRMLFDRYLRMLLERRAEGVIVIASWVFEETNLLADIEKNNVPIVIVGRDLTARRITSVLVDNHEGGALAMRHLLDLGHRRIAVIRGPEEMFDSEPRWQGIRDAACAAGLRIDPRLTFQLPNQVDPHSGFEGGLRFAREMLASGFGCSAVLAFDDLTALGVVRGLLEAGLRVPEDCSVVGFDDILPAAIATPGITTIRQPLNEMGVLAAQRLLEALDQRDTTRMRKARLHRLAPELVVRTSSAPPPTAEKERAPGPGR
ncbi:MAG TPA: LacI family DNA-binding transcriptional regulator [Acidobacteriaceae bacterium]|jgi:LacI family transcriptional regulator|nr:LacI family DNA-binding transcriptional regulator [Acidobacteriaceae bacterium]